MSSSISLIRALATRRQALTEYPPTRYDSDLMMTLVLDNGRWVPSHESDLISGTKKVLPETGEDQQST